MRWILAIAATAACGSSGGSGTNLETVATLPVAERYQLGFEGDGTPLLGFADAQPLLRFDGAGWVPHAATMPFRVSGFGLDLDGAPLVLHRTDSVGTQVYRLEPSGAATPLGAPIQGVFLQVFQHTTGSRFLISDGDRAWILRPGSTAWERLTITLFSVQRGPDGRRYAHSTSGVQRFEATDTTTLALGCNLDICNTARFGIDAGGRFVFNGTMSAIVIDPVSLVTEEVPVPEGHVLNEFGVTPRQSIAVTQGIDDLARPRQAFAFAPGEHGLVLVGVHHEHSLDGVPAVRVHVDPQGTLYVTHGDWLGRVEVAP